MASDERWAPLQLSCPYGSRSRWALLNLLIHLIEVCLFARSRWCWLKMNSQSMGLSAGTSCVVKWHSSRWPEIFRDLTRQSILSRNISNGLHHGMIHSQS